jgi:hypothetical protein
MTMRQSAGGAGGVDEPERDQDTPVRDPAGRREPYVEGPTGPTPLASELRGDPGADGDRGGEGGAAGGALTGTALAGPVGGVVGALAGGAIGTASIDAPGEDGSDDAVDRTGRRDQDLDERR